MKKIITAIAALIAGTAMAAGPYDGIYVRLGAANAYVAIHTNGEQLIATAYTIIPASGIHMTSPIGNVMPTQLNTWDLFSGTISGSTGIVTGRSLFEACNMSMSFNFTGTGAVATLTGLSNTLIGNSSGVNCAALWNIVPGNQANYLRVF